MTNAEELVNDLPIVMVHGGVTRCTGVQGMGLGHPVQYIQVDKRHKYTPTTCKWCGLRFKKISDGHWESQLPATLAISIIKRKYAKLCVSTEQQLTEILAYIWKQRKLLDAIEGIENY